jgi:hypothetical protein
MIDPEKNDVETVKNNLQDIKSYVSEHGGRLKDSGVREMICSLKGSENILKSIYDGDFAEPSPSGPISSAADAITWIQAEAAKLHMKVLINCLLPQLAEKCGDSSWALPNAADAILPQTSMPAAEPALTVTTVGVAGSAHAPVDEPISL